jgi:hypothetical protein
MELIRILVRIGGIVQYQRIYGVIATLAVIVSGSPLSFIRNDAGLTSKLDAKLGEYMKESVSAMSSVVEEVMLIWSIENLGSYARGLPSW